MKDNWMKYRTQFEAIPEPLQKQILLRLGLVLVFLLLFALVLITMYDWMASVPFIGLSVYSAVSAILLFQRSVAGGYVVIRGRCTEVNSTPIRKRTKSVLVDTEEHLVRVTLRQRLKRIPQGAELEVYVADNTQIYEKAGVKQLHTYITIHMIGEQHEDKCRRSIQEAERT